MRVAGRSLALGLVGLGLVGLGLVAPAPASADDPGHPGATSCGSIGSATAPSSVVGAGEPGAPMASLDVAQLQGEIRARGVEPGAGVIVAVVDSGVAPTTTSRPPLGLTRPAAFGVRTPTDGHGTAAAGLIAGRELGVGRPVGIAPAARILDVHLPDRTGAAAAVVDVETLAEALRALGDLPARARPDIVDVAVVTTDSDALAAAVHALTALGVIVVAGSGDRPATDDDFPRGHATPRPGEDVADTVFPAGYARGDRLVVAVGSTVATGEDPLTDVLASSAVTVVAPSAGGVSYAVDGSTCALDPRASTSWSAAEVSGVLAALASVLTDETPAQLVARLEATASGLPAGVGQPHDRFDGAGIVAPLEALDRPLTFDGDTVVGSSAPTAPDVPVALPTPRPDALDAARHRSLWWGLAGGGALLVAVLLRPVLARRRA